MKRKALEKTIIDIIKIIGGIIGGFAFMSIILYLFIKIPFWILNHFELFEKYADYPAGHIYIIELLIIEGIIFSICLIRKLYYKNLKELENEKDK